MVMIGLSPVPVGGGKCRKGTKRRQIVARSSEGTWEGEGEREAGYGRHRRAAPPRRTSSCARAQSMGLRQKDYLESAHAAVRRRRRRRRRIEEEEGRGPEMTEIGIGLKGRGEMGEIHLHTAIAERTADVVGAHAAVRRRRRRGRRIKEEEGGGREMTEVLSTVPITLSDRVRPRGNCKRRFTFWRSNWRGTRVRARLSPNTDRASPREPPYRARLSQRLMLRSVARSVPIHSGQHSHGAAFRHLPAFPRGHAPCPPPAPRFAARGHLMTLFMTNTAHVPC